MRWEKLIFGAVTLGLAAGYAWSAMPLTAQTGAPAAAKATPAEIEHSAYYPDCDAARTQGHAPIFRGQPGYREELDADGDGIACEPFRE